MTAKEADAIKALKPGDRVARYYPGGRGRGLDRYTYHNVTYHDVVRITPTGLIVLDNGERYTPQGKGKMGRYEDYRITPANEEFFGALRRDELIRWLSPRLNLHDLPTATLETIATTLGMDETEGEG